MSIHVPYGGFLATGGPKATSSETVDRLKQLGAGVYSFEKAGVILAVFREFNFQGIWEGEDGAVVYDIDLTNDRELRRLTEVNTIDDPGCIILRLYRRFGSDFLNKLRGAFAFVLWDGKLNKILSATDFYGIRSVVYAADDENWAVASRIRHLLKFPWINQDLDSEAIYHYLYFSAIPSPVSIYKRIHKLEPGNGIEIQRNQVRVFKYYDIRYNPINDRNEQYWKTHIRNEVQEAVRRFIPVSNPDKTGCFLSGGTDSSSITGFYSQQINRPTKTFSIGFNDQAYNELDYAHIASRHFQTEQYDYYVTPKDVLELITALPELYDEPFGNSSVVPAYYCAKLARDNGVDMLLGGDGGDEIFGGNERYVKNLMFALYGQLPNIFCKKIFESILHLLPDISVIHKVKRYVRRANIHNPDRFFSYNLLYEMSPEVIFQSDYLASLNIDCFLDLARKHYQNATPAQETDRLMYMDMKFTITDNDLRKVTQMAESVGVRVRYPLLDRDLVDFTTTIPPNLKVKRKKNRYIFKRAMEGFLPPQIIKKKKHGMGIPISLWFKKDVALSELLTDTLFTGIPELTHYVKPGFIRKIQKSFEKDKTTYFGDNLWVLLVLELWLKNKRLLDF